MVVHDLPVLTILVILWLNLQCAERILEHENRYKQFGMFCLYLTTVIDSLSPFNSPVVMELIL